ncbi:hypothetical protein F8388_018745 [Cannabis sativa]|uniref:Uncharacterized protein n=1 Tax=Cannabis sativa TaxID=3483 RepID=A0A7J6GM84_CANSA|nr:hypothetical protein F8388_018745 [Cannabis sativa]
MVLNSVISPAIEEAGYGCPLVPEPRMSPNDRLILVRSKGSVLNLRRKLITPPQTARLSGPTRDRFTNERPVPRAIVLDKPPQGLILFGAPWTFDPIHIFLCRRHYNNPNQKFPEGGGGGASPWSEGKEMLQEWEGIYMEKEKRRFKDD